MQRSLTRNLRTVSKAGNNLPGVIIDVHGDRASVRLSSNGSIMRYLMVIGGPVVIDDPVEVDFSRNPPAILATGATWLTENQMLAAIARARKDKTGQSNLFAWQIMHFQGGLVGVYDTNGAGLEDAISVAVDGDVIMIPATELSSTFTIPAGVSIVGINSMNSVILGTVTMTDGSELRDLCVRKQADSESEIIKETSVPIESSSAPSNSG